MFRTMQVRVGYVVVIAIFFAGSPASALQSSKPETDVRELRVERILLKTTLPVLPAMADINGDSLPDLFIGSKGHDFVAGEIPSLISLRKHPAINQLSIHLNRSTKGSVEFDAPYWIAEVMANAVLPDG